MALIQCTECGHSVSSRAAACPNCGCPVEAGVAVAPAPMDAAPEPAAAVLRPVEAPAVSSRSQPLPPYPPPSRWRTDRPAPWSRFAARYIDIVIYSVLIGFPMGLFGSMPSNPIVLQVVVLCANIPLGAVVIGVSGASVGKWLFGVRVVGADGQPIGIGKAFERELDVTFRGMGLGVPIVTLVTQAAAYSRLTKTGAAAWDGETSQVRYLEQTTSSRAIAIVGAVVLVGVLSALAVAGR